MDEIGDIQMRECVNIARAIERQVKKNEGENITSSQIREMVNAKLIERGEVDKAREYERIGIPVADIESIIVKHKRDNANLMRAPRTVEKFVADEALKQYALNHLLPPHISKLHMNGDIRLHDLDYYATRPINCMQGDLRWFIKEGLKIDGSGKHASVAGPAKNLMTFVNQAGEVLLAQQQNLSGGVGLPLANIFMAPFAEGLSYDEIKQTQQMFIYNINNAYVDRGSQVPFSSVGLEMGVPKFLENETAYGKGGKKVGVYGDFFEEAQKIQRAFTDVMKEGDYTNKAHIFPNTLYSLRKEYFKPEFEDELKNIHELSIKYSTPYFINQENSLNCNTSIMGCRTRLNDDFTGDWEKDGLRTGNLAYSTINLPRISYKSNNLDEYFDNLKFLMDNISEYLLLRRERAEKCLGSYELLPFLSQTNSDKNMYYQINNSSLAFGFSGMHEALLGMDIKNGLLSKEGQKESNKILDYMNGYVSELKNETGLRWGVFATPAESAASDFAKKDQQLYNSKKIKNFVYQGTKDVPYYSNSTHLPVNSELSLPERIKIESQLHTKTSAGNIMHLWLSEQSPDIRALSSLTKKIFDTKANFFTYTSAFSHCFKCNNTMRGTPIICDKCGSNKIETYSRVSGYLQKVSGFNDGKQEEFKDRFLYEV